LILHQNRLENLISRACFNFLGSILNADNKINIKIAERTVKGNKTYYANAKLIKSKYQKRNAKMKIRVFFSTGATQPIVGLYFAAL
jgi:hypothetical protein